MGNDGITFRPEAPVSLTSLPDEVLQHILYFVSPNHVLQNVQRVSKRFYTLGSEPVLWRYHCQAQFKYWDPKHRIGLKFLGCAGNVDWKTLFIHRQKVNSQTTCILDSILQGQVNRIKKFSEIIDFGYDAKDILLQHCRTNEGAEDVLARRYYATAVLDHLHRSKALSEWSKLGRGENIPLERALGAFDLFVLHDQEGDLLEVSILFDDLAARFRVESLDFDQLSLRKKALAIVAFLRAHNMIGIDTDVSYNDLQNNYMGIALQDKAHPSLPLISVAIFCILAKRLGVDARCCVIPQHVHAVVYPSSYETLDGRKSEDRESEPMYLDPFRSDDEVSVAGIREILAAWGIPSVDFAWSTLNSTTAALVLRTSRSILTSVQIFTRNGGNAENAGHPTVQLYANPYADMDNAFYSALWARFMMSNSFARFEISNQRDVILLILEKFERLYPMDASLIEQYICPLFNNPSNTEHWDLHEALRVVRAADQSPRQLRLRDTSAVREKVKYKVGQIFRHKRYAYTAVITGWDIECGMNSDWMAHNNVDSLAQGRYQSFYHALVQDASIRYVAEENVETIEEEVPHSLMSLAGRYFKRWDKEKQIFVSNIRDEYPED